MTLIVARRLNGKVSLSADSRITFGDLGSFDRGVKIFKVPVRIKGPLKTVEDRNKWEYDLIYGMAIAGSTTNAYSVKESLTAIIGNIQYMTNLSDISIVGIGAFVFNRFKDISSELAPVMRAEGLSEIIFAGWCPVAGQVRVLRFYPDVSATEVEYRAEEILQNDGWFFAGSGKKSAEIVHRDHPDFSALRVIRTVIDRRMERTVGGLLQTGGFPLQDFTISAVKDEVADIQGKSIPFKHYFGFDLNQKDSTKKYPLLFISHGSVEIDWDWPGGVVDRIKK